MPGISIAVKRAYFDAKKIIGRVDRATEKNLKWYGAATRRSARRAIGKPAISKAPRLPTKPRPAPKPPRARRGDTIRLIWWEYNSRKQTVIVGPERLADKRKVNGGKTVPQAHEEGGTATAKIVRFRPKGKRRFVYAHVRDAKPIRIRLKKRPFMKPAADENRAKAVAKFRDALTR